MFEILTIDDCLFSSRLHGPSNGLDQDTESERSNSIEDRNRRKIRDENNDPKENNERDQIVYLKELEKSLRTGKRIETDDDDEPSEDGSQTKSTNRFMHFIRKHLRRHG